MLMVFMLSCIMQSMAQMVAYCDFVWIFKQKIIRILRGIIVMELMWTILLICIFSTLLPDNSGAAHVEWINLCQWCCYAAVVVSSVPIINVQMPLKEKSTATFFFWSMYYNLKSASGKKWVVFLKSGLTL